VTAGDKEVDVSVYVGLDIGGTKFIAAASDNNGNIIKKRRKPTPLELDKGLDLLNQMTEEVADGVAVAGMGAAIGGPLDFKKGVVSPLHQPSWRNVPLKKIMEKRWECAFHVDVDTNVAALGEYYRSKDAPDRMLYITISTGMGGGFLMDGKIYRGMNGSHPEIGHQSINFRCSNPSRINCECGVSDCLEALVSGNGIRRIYNKSAEELTAEQWEEVSYNLGQGLRNLAAIYLPDVIVLGGGVALGGGDRLLKTAVCTMKKHLKLVPAPEVRISHLGYGTALAGAIYIAVHGL
jgi:predicted NBD/HSP70 family sugar kinase